MRLIIWVVDSVQFIKKSNLAEDKILKPISLCLVNIILWIKRKTYPMSCSFLMSCLERKYLFTSWWYSCILGSRETSWNNRRRARPAENSRCFKCCCKMVLTGCIFCWEQFFVLVSALLLQELSHCRIQK